MNTNHENHDAREIDQARLTAYALGQLDDAERAEVEALLAGSDEARKFVAETTALAGHVQQAHQQAPNLAASPSIRAAIEKRLAEGTLKEGATAGLSSSAGGMYGENTAGQASSGTRPKRSWLRPYWLAITTTTCTCLFLIVCLIVSWTYKFSYHRHLAERPQAPCQAVPAELAATPGNQAQYDSPATSTLNEGIMIGGRGLPKDVGQSTITIHSRNKRFFARRLPKADTTRGELLRFAPRPIPKEGKQGKTGIYTTPNTEQYDRIVDNEFRPVEKQPLSTFSIDVDTASYANMRRFLREGRLPPPDAVRIEEMVNYFTYDYPQPTGKTPFSVNMEVAECPWKPGHRLLRIGLKGREIDRRELGPSNLVFLLDVSGSMNQPNKLPLVKQAMRMLVEQLTEDDRVAIVTYASGVGVPLSSARGNEQRRILGAIDSLEAGGSTFGSAGIELAYRQAAEHFVRKGINRVILCTDGDLNVGITNDDDLVRLIEQKAKSGVFLTVLGFGTGNLKDSKMEKLADHGNGLYAYIDSLREARRVLIEQMTGSLATIAKDVKLQIEFNPAEVAAYRLIGYENRVLANRDFDDDRKDAGEIGAGHTVTALYELVPANVGHADGTRPLKYQQVPKRNLTDVARGGELLTLRLRYKEPDENESKLLERTVRDSGAKFGRASDDFRFASAVAAFGMVLRSSPYLGNATLAAVEEYAAGALGKDPNGYRAEFLDLVRRARGIQ